MEIKKISSSDEFFELIRKREPKGLFYYKYRKYFYIGINNMRGNVITNQFRKLKDCKSWLKEHERYGG